MARPPSPRFFSKRLPRFSSAGLRAGAAKDLPRCASAGRRARTPAARSEEHTSELQSLMRISYAVFCLKKKKKSTHAYTGNVKKTTINTTHDITSTHTHST